MIIGVTVILAVIVIGVIAICQSSRYSKKSFDATIQEIFTQPDEDVWLIVEQTSEIYGSSINSFGISGDRKWRTRKEAGEKVLQGCGVDEVSIEQIRIDDRAAFNSNRRF